MQRIFHCRQRGIFGLCVPLGYIHNDKIVAEMSYLYVLITFYGGLYGYRLGSKHLAIRDRTLAENAVQKFENIKCLLFHSLFMSHRNQQSKSGIKSLEEIFRVLDSVLSACGFRNRYCAKGKLNPGEHWHLVTISAPEL